MNQFLQKIVSHIPFLRDTRVNPKAQQERTYRELSSLGGVNSDWNLNLLGEDSEVWQNAWALTGRVRDLARCNPIFQAYRETVWSNVLGAQGILYRPKIKETEDRIIHTPDEEKWLKSLEERQNRVREFFAKKQGREFVAHSLIRCLGNNGSRQSTVKVGEPDLYASKLILAAWNKWQRKEFCDARGTRNYRTIRQLRLWSAVRDGDFFIRKIAMPGVNSFGFALQMINAEWCDRFFNVTLSNGNQVRMGIEYQCNSWGIGKPVAYYFIKRQPNDWQFSIPGAFNFTSGDLHVRVPAEEIIHYARVVDADATRPAPWVASAIPSARQLDQAMLAEVIAWREAACKTGFYYSEVMPEGGVLEAPPDPRQVREETMGPGDKRGLPFGVKYQANDPTHPNADVKDFRMAAIQSMVAGMPGANYSTMANDYAAINFSAGRLQRLDSNENYELLQTFDIDYAERPIFESWLEMALIVGKEIALPLAKLEKFKAAEFSARRWQGVDPVKDETASALAIENKLSTWTGEAAERGKDWEEIIFRQAEERMIMEELGMDATTTQSGAPPIGPAADMSAEELDAADEAETKPQAKPKKPAAKKYARF